MRDIILLCLLIAASLFSCSVATHAGEVSQDVYPMMGTYKSQTIHTVSTDTDQRVTSMYNAKLTTAIDFIVAKIKFIIISCETSDVRYAFGTNATQNATAPVGHILSAGQTMHLPSPSMLRNMHIISKTASTPATLQITVGY